MPAIIDPDEIQNATTQLNNGQSSPAVMAPSGGAIIDQDELANARAQLGNGPAIGGNQAAPKTGWDVPQPAAFAGQAVGPAPPKTWGDTIDEYARLLEQHIPFTDRVAAAATTLTGTGVKNGDYATNLQDQRWKNQAAVAAHPYLAEPLGLAGSAGALLAGAPEAALAAPTLAGRMFAGAGTGAIYGGVEGASAAPDLTNVPDAAKRAAIGAGIGAGVGAATPIAANAIGSAYNTAANAITGGTEGISRRAAAPLLSAIAADTPGAIQASASRLGDQGMLADFGPALQGKAQGVALNSDEARTILTNALKARDDLTNARLASDINAAIGPAQSPLQASQALQAQRSLLHQGLPQIFANAGPVDTSGVLATIGQGLNKAVGPEAAVLGKARSYLMRNGVDAQGNPAIYPVNDAETLQNAKTALDTLIDHGDPSLGVVPGAISKSQGAVANVRKQLNQALRDQVPGYSDIMDRSSALAKQMEGIETGNSILSSGQNALSPDDLNLQMRTGGPGGGPMTPEQIAGLRLGARGAIDRAVGTKANDLVALRNAMQGEGGWNEGKLSNLFGAGPTGQIVNSIDQNSAFRNTLQNVVQNSQTAQRQAAAAAMKPEAATGGIPYINPNMTLTGAAMTPVRAMGSALLNQLRPDPTRAYGEIARVLTAQGPERDNYLAALLSTMNRRGSNAATARAIGNPSALSAALIGNQYANDRLQPP